MSPADFPAWRASVNLSQAQAAERLGVSLRAWQRWEDGSRVPPPYLFRALRDLERELATRR